MKTYKVEFTQEERDTILAMIIIGDMVELPNKEAIDARIGMQASMMSVIDKLNPQEEDQTK